MGNNGQAHFKSRFGYIMVAAGAAIGLGNIWKFPYLAYRGGGGINPYAWDDSVRPDRP